MRITFVIFHPSHPSIRKRVPSGLAVNPVLDPGGSGKELVGKGYGTVRSRLCTSDGRIPGSEVGSMIRSLVLGS